MYDGGPLDEDGKKDIVVTYTTYWGTAPLSIDGIPDCVRQRLGQNVPSGVPDILYSQIGTHEGSFAIPARALTATWHSSRSWDAVN